MSKIKIKGFRVKQEDGNYSNDIYTLGPVNIDDGNGEGSLKTAGVDQEDRTLGQYSFSEGFSTLALGNYSHAQGQNTSTTVNGIAAHAEGNGTTASGNYSHAEGYSTTASGSNSHSEGYRTEASGDYSHAEGESTIASGDDSHAEGFQTTASGDISHAEGNHTTASGADSHAEGASTTASKQCSHAEGANTIASGPYSHAQNLGTIASSTGQTAIGKYNIADSNDVYSFIIGNGSSAIRSNALMVDWNGNLYLSGQVKNNSGESIYNNNLKNLVDGSIPGSVRGVNSAKEGIINEGTTQINYKMGFSAIAEGYNTQASGDNSHAEGSGSKASAICSHAEGGSTIASGLASHAEGGSTIASGSGSHAQGSSSKAIGESSHAQGNVTIANGNSSHAQNFQTIASSDYQTAIGKYNIEDSNNIYSLIIGNGDNNARSNALTIDWNGKTSFGSSETVVINPVNTSADHIIIGNNTSSNTYSLKVQNSLHALSFNANTSGNAGIWDMTNSRWIVRNGIDGITYLGNTAQVYVDNAAFKAGSVTVSGGISTNNKTSENDEQTGVYINSVGNIHLTGDTNSGSGLYFYFNKSSLITASIHEESSGTLKLFNNVKVNGTLTSSAIGTGGRTAWNDASTSGCWISPSGAIHLVESATSGGSIGFHYNFSSSTTSSISENASGQIHISGKLDTGGTITSLSDIYARVASGEARIQADNNGNNKIYLYANSNGNVGIYAYAANGTAINILSRANNTDFIEMGANLVNKSTYNNTASNAANMFVNSSGTYVRSTASSKRYKHDIEPLTDYCNVLNIPVVSYKYNKDYLSSSDRRYDIDIPGFIAEDVEQYYPIATEYNNDGEVEDWNVRMIVPPMLAVEQKHDKQIQLLIKENKELKQKLNYILSKIS